MGWTTTKRGKRRLRLSPLPSATGSFNDPFDRVDFWMMDVNGAHWKLPVTASVEAGRTDDRIRDVDILGGSSCSHAAYDDQGGRFPAG